MEDNQKEIILQRSDNLGFGFSIIGGAGSDLPPVICDIVENSPAYHTEELRAGDVIVSVNGIDVADFTTKEVLKTLRLSGSSLKLWLREDKLVKQRAERFLSCGPEDIDTLKDAISQKDLTGVDEIIVKRYNSPRSSPKKVCYEDRPILTGSPRMPRRMEGEPMNGKHETGGVTARSIRPPKNLENGYGMGDADDSTNGGGGSSLTTRSEKSRFETFVMTGEMIIRTSPHHKSDSITGKPPPPEKKRKAESPSAKETSSPKIIHSPKGSPKKEVKNSPGKHSRIPRPNTGSTPKSSPKESPRSSPKKSADAPLHTKLDGKGYSVQNHFDASNISCESAAAYIQAQCSPSADTNADRPYELELLGYTRYPDMPIELDIPPDDISSEDEKYRNEELVNVDDLPPPPDEFFHEEVDKSAPHSVARIQSVLNGMSPENSDHCRALSNPNNESTIASQDVPLPDFPSPTSPVLVVNRHYHQGSCTPVESGSAPMVPYGADHTRSLSDSSPFQIPAGDNTSWDYDTRSVSSDTRINHMQELPAPGRTIVVSRSAEKIANKHKGVSMATKQGAVVRSSRSQENYLDDGMTFVDIDFEENMASSVDALHYEKSYSSIDSLSRDHLISLEHTRSLDNSPEKRTSEKTPEKVFMPGFITLEEPRSITKLKEGGRLRDFTKQPSSEESRDTPTDSCKVTLQSQEGTTAPDAGELADSAISLGDTGISSSSEDMCNPAPQVRPAVEGLESAREDYDPNANMQYVEPEVHIQGVTHTFSSDSSVAEMAVTEQSPHPAQSHTSPSHHHGALYKADSNQHEPGIDADPTGSPTHQRYDGEEAHRGSAPSSPSKGEGKEGDLHSEAGSLYHQPIKDVDRPSAARLAKRLYNLDGFRKNDISRHLHKKNDFAQLVGEEYLKYFSFTGESLDLALRNFLKHLTLAGETQERERVLAHFSRRFMESNPAAFNSEDSCHTLTCALMLLNTDLHGHNIGRKMSPNEFIENLSDLNDGENFPKEVLKDLYLAIKNEPLQCEFSDSGDEESEDFEGMRGALAAAAAAGPGAPAHLGHNPFLDIPDPSKAIEYKKGYVMRKSCVDPDGRKTPLGRRGWKMLYATLRDMVVYIHKDEHGFKKNAVVTNMGSAIRVHHALATKAVDYKKKQHVFRVQTSDWAEFLFQTSDSKECQEWIDTINFVAASLSAPPLPGGVGSRKKFQRPLLPSSCTRLNMREQLQSHEQKQLQFEQDLIEHRKSAPEKGMKGRVIQDYVEKETYLQFELRRFKTYTFLLQAKMASFPELEPSLVEISIGEVDEPPASPINESSHLPTTKTPVATSSPVQNRKSKPVQRSMSDRQNSVSDSEPVNALNTTLALLPPLQATGMNPVVVGAGIHSPNQGLSYSVASAQAHNPLVAAEAGIVHAAPLSLWSADGEPPLNPWPPEARSPTAGVRVVVKSAAVRRSPDLELERRQQSKRAPPVRVTRSAPSSPGQGYHSAQRQANSPATRAAPPFGMYVTPSLSPGSYETQV